MERISEKSRKLLRMVYRCLWIVMALFSFKSCTTKPIIIEDMIVPEYGPPIAVENPVEEDAEEDVVTNENVNAE